MSGCKSAGCPNCSGVCNKYSKEQKAKLITEKKKIEEALEKDDLAYIQNLLKERLVIWFKFFFARVILQRYCNIPAGLLVVKFEDYSSRMITECYLDKKLINIGRQQNDWNDPENIDTN